MLVIHDAARGGLGINLKVSKVKRNRRNRGIRLPPPHPPRGRYAQPVYAHLAYGCGAYGCTAYAAGAYAPAAPCAMLNLHGGSSRFRHVSRKRTFLRSTWNNPAGFRRTHYAGKEYLRKSRVRVTSCGRWGCDGFFPCIEDIKMPPN